ncbi:DUF1697 domain-containing protein [Kocuria soli]|uniref:DUF1697 domain-containing protein n=1 Tax=Kocuria soli TaxID=2485125 RepID=A0A3N3ZSN5_9MICC|nr:DUF1697 domain-containing protein [Kocuria soli]ROZ64592.1 DUF1697 domain-containing protein [Kocuria soli]
MGRVVVLLRGINVGGRHKVPMARLRELATDAGLTDCVTYIQSGNLVASDPLNREPAALTDELAGALRAAFGFEVPTVVVPNREFTAAVQRCPWPEVEDPRFVHGIFFPTAIPEDLASRARAFMTPDDPDRVEFDGQVMWLWTPHGLSKSRVAEPITRLALPDGRRGTARNLRSLREITARI